MDDVVKGSPWWGVGVAVVLALPMVLLMATVLIATVGALLVPRGRERHARQILDRLVDLAAVMRWRPDTPGATVSRRIKQEGGALGSGENESAAPGVSDDRERTTRIWGCCAPNPYGASRGTSGDW